MRKQSKVMKVHVDLAKNRLYCTVGGNIELAEMNTFYTEIRFAVADLQPGFDVITDLTEARLGHLAALPTFKKVMHYIASNEAGSVVRAMPNKNIFYRQIMNYASRSQGYAPIYVDSLEEAEELLDAKIKRAGLRFNLIDKVAQYTLNDRPFTGTVLNISASGCAISTTETLPEIGEAIRLRLSLISNDQESREFTIKASAIRHFDGGFAVRFSEEFEAEKKDFWRCLLHEAERDL